MEGRRSNQEQFTLMVDFMERNGDLTRPQQGPQGRIRSDQKWQELTDFLNSCGGGVNKPTEKWKKVWVDWKTKTKKKALLIRRDARRTGGGPSSRQALTALEERVLAVMGLSAVVGQRDVPERGFDIRPPQSQTLLSENPIPGGSAHSPHIELILDSQNQVAMEVAVEVHHGSEHLSGTSEGQLPLPSSQTPPTSMPLPPSHTPLPPTHTSLLPSHTPLPLTHTPLPPTDRPLESQSHAPLPRSHTPTSPLHEEKKTPSEFSSPRRHRRRRIQTPFERATNEFVAVEMRRLRLEDTRERNLQARELERERLLHEREVERLRLESQRLEVERSRNEILNHLAQIAQRLTELLPRHL